MNFYERREAFTRDHAARLLDVSPNTLTKWRNEGRIEPVSIGGIERYTRRDLERLLYGDAHQQERSMGGSVEPSQAT